MNKYQDLYKKNGLISSKCAEQRINNLKSDRRNKRSEALDFRRKKAIADSEDLNPSKKTISKLKGHLNNKWRPIKKEISTKEQLPPFIVGVVRHKIHSPPFLHEPLDTGEQIKNCFQNSRQSFAPKNYKFKPPKEIKINIFTPTKVENNQSSPFTLRSLLREYDENNVSSKKLDFKNVNTHPRKRKLSYDSPSTITSDTEKVEEDYDKNNYDSVKKQLWSEDLEDSPIFGRLNVVQATQKCTTDFSKDQKEISSIFEIQKGVTLPSRTTFNCIPKSESTQLKTYQEPNIVFNEVLKVSPTSTITTLNSQEENINPFKINKVNPEEENIIDKYEIKSVEISKIEKPINVKNDHYKQADDLIYDESTLLQTAISPIMHHIRSPEIKKFVELDVQKKNININKTNLTFLTSLSLNKKVNSKSLEIVNIEDVKKKINNEDKNSIFNDSDDLLKRNSLPSKLIKTLNTINPWKSEETENDVNQTNLSSLFANSSKTEINITSPLEIKDTDDVKERSNFEYLQEENIILDLNHLQKKITKPLSSYAKSQGVINSQEFDDKHNTNVLCDNKNALSFSSSSIPEEKQNSNLLSEIIETEVTKKEVNDKDKSAIFDDLDSLWGGNMTIPIEYVKTKAILGKSNNEEASGNANKNNLLSSFDNFLKKKINTTLPSELKDTNVGEEKVYCEENIMLDDQNSLIEATVKPSLSSIKPLHVIKTQEYNLKYNSTYTTKNMLHNSPITKYNINSSLENTDINDEDKSIVNDNLDSLREMNMATPTEFIKTEIKTIATLPNNKKNSENANQNELSSSFHDSPTMGINMSSPSKVKDINVRDEKRNSEDENVILENSNYVLKTITKPSCTESQNVVSRESENQHDNTNVKNILSNPLSNLHKKKHSNNLSLETRNSEDEDEEKETNDETNNPVFDDSLWERNTAPSFKHTNIEDITSPWEFGDKEYNEIVNENNSSSLLNDSLKLKINTTLTSKVPSDGGGEKYSENDNVILDKPNLMLETITNPLSYTNAEDTINPQQSEDTQNCPNRTKNSLSFLTHDSPTKEMDTTLRSEADDINSSKKDINNQDENITIDHVNSLPNMITRSPLDPTVLKNVNSFMKFDKKINPASIKKSFLKSQSFDLCKEQINLTSLFEYENTEVQEKRTNNEDHCLIPDYLYSLPENINKPSLDSVKSLDIKNFVKTSEENYANANQNNLFSKICNSPNEGISTFSSEVKNTEEEENLRFQECDLFSENISSKVKDSVDENAKAIVESQTVIDDSNFVYRTKSQDELNYIKNDDKENSTNVDQSDLSFEQGDSSNKEMNTTSSLKIMKNEDEQIKANENHNLIVKDTNFPLERVGEPSLECTEKNHVNIDQNNSSQSYCSFTKEISTPFLSEGKHNEGEKTTVIDKVIPDVEKSDNESSNVNIDKNNLSPRFLDSSVEEINTIFLCKAKNTNGEEEKNKNLISHNLCSQPKIKVRLSLNQTNPEDLNNFSKPDNKESTSLFHIESQELMSPLESEVKDVNINKNISPSLLFQSSEEQLNTTFISKYNNITNEENDLNDEEIVLSLSLNSMKLQNQINTKESNEEKKSISLNNSPMIALPKNKINTTFSSQPVDIVRIQTSSNNQDNILSYDESNSLPEVINYSLLEQTKEQGPKVSEQYDEKKESPKSNRICLRSSPLHDLNKNQNNITSLSQTTDIIGQDENLNIQGKVIMLKELNSLSKISMIQSLHRKNSQEVMKPVEIVKNRTTILNEKSSPSALRDSIKRQNSFTSSSKVDNFVAEEENQILQDENVINDENKFLSKMTKSPFVKSKKSNNKKKINNVNNDNLLSTMFNSTPKDISSIPPSQTEKLVAAKKSLIDEFENTLSDESEASSKMIKSPSLDHTKSLVAEKIFSIDKVQDPINSEKKKIKKKTNKTAKVNENILTFSSNNSTKREMDTFSSIEDATASKDNSNEKQNRIDNENNSLSEATNKCASDCTKTQDTKNSGKYNVKENIGNVNKNISPSPIRKYLKRQNKLSRLTKCHESESETNNSNNEDDVIICYESNSLSNKENILFNCEEIEDTRKYIKLNVKEEIEEITENEPASDLPENSFNSQFEAIKDESIKNILNVKSTTNPNILVNLVKSPMENKVLGKSKKVKPCKDSCKLPIRFSKRLINNGNDISESNKKEIIDLISDDEEDYTFFLSRVLAAHANSSTSKSIIGRIAMSSIENIPKVQNSPCKTPELNISRREKSPDMNTTITPIRIMRLRNRTVDISPSPKKRKERRK